MRIKKLLVVTLKIIIQIKVHNYFTNKTVQLYNILNNIHYFIYYQDDYVCFFK
jgi:hypothetical protein